MPVLWQAPTDPPAVEPFTVSDRTGPGRFLLGVIFSVRRFTVPAAVLAVLWQVGEALVPVVMGAAIDRALTSGDVAELALWLIVLAAVFLTLSLAFRFAAQLTARATEMVQHRLRATLSQSVLHAYGPGVRQPDGRVVSMMTNDVTRLAAVGLTVYPVAEFAGIVFIAASLLIIHWPLGVTVLAGAPVIVLLVGLLSRRLARDTREYQTLLASTVGRATDLMAGYRVIKGLRAEPEAARRYQDASQQTLAGAYRNVGLLGRFLVGSTIVNGVFVAGVAALAGWFAVTGELSVGQLIAAVGLAQALLPPMRMLAMNAVPAAAAALASGGRILDRLKDLPETTPAQPLSQTVPTRAPILELSVAPYRTVRMKPAEMVGLRAAEGTCTEIVDALMNPHTGTGVQVSVDGEPAQGFPHHVYRSTVVVSPHHGTLFSGTIAENLTSASGRSRLWEEALWAASCEDFLTTAGGIQRQVGEMGNRLSGGQRQRVALARALAHDAPVLILHDPTTAVDSVTERVIASRLRKLRRNRSTMLIASSPALLSVCDRIIDLREQDKTHTGGHAA